MNAKILIADDESDIVSMLGSFFESKGFRVLPACCFPYRTMGMVLIKTAYKKPQIRTSQGKATIPSISDLGYIFVSYFVNTITVI